MPLGVVVMAASTNESGQVDAVLQNLVVSPPQPERIEPAVHPQTLPGRRPVREPAGVARVARMGRTAYRDSPM